MRFLIIGKPVEKLIKWTLITYDVEDSLVLRIILSQDNFPLI